jgi:hypothetical protein
LGGPWRTPIGDILAPMGEDSREKQRFTVWFPMKLETPDEPHGVAVSRNVSGKGLLMATADELDIGKPVTVTFRLSGDAPERTVQGTIVRSEVNSDDPDGLWPYRVAVQFAETLDELEPTLRDLSEKQPL